MASEAEFIPPWLRPPPEGWTAEHLDELPPNAPRMEMIDGALIMMSPQTSFHSRVVRRLANALEEAAPDTVGVETEMTVKLARRQRPEPDIIAFRPQMADPERSRTYYQPEEVVLVIEVVSPESEERDRETKRMKYAKAGIQHFWLVENESGKPVIHVMELGTTGAYVETAIERERLKLDVPFPMDIDVKALSR
ncbi:MULTISPECIES: Uma2 family endonuclease [unclassified Spirillospora]|uniref:Uma2 family endonuclease n=1 Tax=unclassified Spirillospora TaxID=2642701 RepID=UPI00371B3BE0